MATLRDAASTLTDARAPGTRPPSARAATPPRWPSPPAPARRPAATRSKCSAWPRSSPTPPASTPRPMRLVGEGTLPSSWAAGAPASPASRPRPAPRRWTSRIGPPATTRWRSCATRSTRSAPASSPHVTDASGARLVLRSAATGEANGFRIGVTDTDGNNIDGVGLSALAFDPSAGILTDGAGAGRSQRGRQPQRRCRSPRPATR